MPQVRCRMKDVGWKMQEVGIPTSWELLPITGYGSPFLHPTSCIFHLPSLMACLQNDY